MAASAGSSLASEPLMCSQTQRDATEALHCGYVGGRQMTWNSGRMVDAPGAQYISTSAYPEPIVIRDAESARDPDDDCDDDCACGDDLG